LSVLLVAASRTVEDSRRYAPRNTMLQLRRRPTRPVANETLVAFLATSAPPAQQSASCDAI
jgi:hypothetical protein